MTKFEGCYLTDAGVEIAKDEGLGKIVFTKAATGDGKYLSKNEVKTLTALKNQKQQFSLRSFEQTGHAVKIFFDISNTGLTETYKMSEVGLFALDKDGNEVLYCVAFAYSGNEEQIPKDEGTYRYFLRMSIETNISDEATVEIVMSEVHVDNELSTQSIYPVANKVLTSVLLKFINTDTIDTAFHEVFPDSPEPEPPEPETDPNALTPTAITDALDTPWDGSSSTDTLALKSDAIADTLEAEWDGSSSTDTLALKAYQINEICK